ncbi:MAG TPA: hypothetical protein VFP72_21325 [Kineosporiaceae bacterium]|nr:hypothetical protein [Kineosporiaceae bacterium]
MSLRATGSAGPARAVATGIGPRRTPAVVTVALALGVGVLAGCSGGGSPAGGSGGGPTRQGSPAAATTGTPGTGGPVPDPSSTSPGAATGQSSVAVTTLPPVSVGRTATVTSGVTVSVSGLSTLTVTAAAPGDTSGPAVSFVVEVDNHTAKAVDLDGVAITVSYGNGIPAAPSSAAPNAPFGGSLAPGKSAQGTYVFRVPPSGAGSVQIQVASNFAAGIAVFRR